MFGTNYNEHRVAMGFLEQSQGDADAMFYHWAVWTREFVWLPHRCDITKRIIWLQRAYRGRAVWGPGNNVVETRWHTSDEHLIYLLKRN